MARKRTGLHNRFRTGRSTYSIKNKSRGADVYGSYTRGKSDKAENIAGESYSHGYPIPYAMRSQTAKYKYAMPGTDDLLHVDASLESTEGSRRPSPSQMTHDAADPYCACSWCGGSDWC